MTLPALKRVRPVDLLFGGVATCFGLVSLAYPFGRDQGLFYYAAREWLLRGQVLYRDVWDHKPPVIYLIHMLAIALFGEHMWGIRLIELAVTVPALAWATARLASPRGQPIPDGAWGAAWLGIAVTYYGYCSFWETGQCEIWGALFATCSLTAAWHARRQMRGYAAAGVFCALSLFTKPPMIFFVLLTVGAVVLRTRAHGGEKTRAAVRGLAVFALGGCAVCGAILLYFAAHGALQPMLDILIFANGVYVDKERTFNNAGDFLTASLATVIGLTPYSGAFILIVGCAFFLGFVSRDRSLLLRYSLPVLLVMASYGAVVIQLKMYAYHWVTIVAASGVLTTNVYLDLARIARSRPAGWLAPLVLLAFVPGMFPLSGPPVQRWLITTAHTLRYELGRINREELSFAFDLPPFYAYHDAELTGLWIRRHSRPEDTLVVRGFEPEIYAISGRHFTGRFFWTTFLASPTRKYKREQWLAEDRRALERHPPRYAVMFAAVETGIDSASWFEELGYERRIEIGAFVVLEHKQHAPGKSR